MECAPVNGIKCAGCGRGVHTSGIYSENCQGMGMGCSGMGDTVGFEMILRRWREG